MRRVFAVVCLAVLASTTSAQSKTAVPPAPSAAPASVQDLPVRKVVLYKNGVGYFEHAGTVTGNQTVSVDFTSSQLNDVLQSLTVLDEGGGRIAGVNYNSTTPLAEQLKTLSLGMGDDPTSTELFQALRGQRVEVTGGPGGPVTGRLMSIEARSEKIGTGDTTVDKFYITVIGTSGAVRVVELTPTLTVRPLDSNLQGQLDRYLELLSSTHANGLRHLTLNAVGQGQRELRVSYISEVPVWKATYRIVFPRVDNEKANAIVQGWAVVDNTVGADWNNVQLSLVAGAPQSFIQPLSQPLYTRRPEIPITTSQQAAPQIHDAAEKEFDKTELTGKLYAPSPAPVPRAMKRVAENEAPPSQTFGVAGMAGAGGGLGGSYGPGVGAGAGGGFYRPSDAFDEKNVSTNAFDDFFQYSLTQPVKIHKNESAMVPILQQNLPAEHVTLWSAKEAAPLRAVWVENTSKLTLDSGSFSIFESGEFAGEGLLDPLHPGEKRLLSYAVDQAVKVHRSGFAETRTLHHIAMHDGVLVETTSDVTENNYSVTNGADEARTVIVEHPRKPNAELDSESKPAETTANVYRFRVVAQPHESMDLKVGEKANLSEKIRIDAAQDHSGFLVTISKFSPDLESKLKPLVDAETTLAGLNRRVSDLQQKEKTLSDDEARARDNITALKNNDAAKRFVEQLNHTEDDLQTARRDRAALEKDRDAARAKLNDLIGQLSFETDLSVVTQSGQQGNKPPRR